jgi:hypothetical protein
VKAGIPAVPTCLMAAGLGALVLACAPTAPPSSGAVPRERGSDPLSRGTAPVRVVQPQPAPGSCRARGAAPFSLPDPRCTPGAIDPAVGEENVEATICREGFTATQRPPESVSEPEKRASLAAYGKAGPLHDYEYDHLIPLELGGAANDPRNLWPEPGASPNPKDALENRLAGLVCRRRIGLADAQRLTAEDWVAAYRRYVSPGAAR